jgi:hypothetical protein
MSLHDLLAGKPCDASLRGRRVLVVEDDYLLAEDLREELQSSGAEAIGPVAGVADDLALLEAGPAPDMAALLEETGRAAPHGPAVPSSGHGIIIPWPKAKTSDGRLADQALIQLTTPVSSDSALRGAHHHHRLRPHAEAPRPELTSHTL